MFELACITMMIIGICGLSAEKNFNGWDEDGWIN